jgi:hypothetical protein
MLEIWLSNVRKRSMEMRNWSFCSVPEFVEDNGLDQTEVVVGWTGEASRGGESNSPEEERLSSPPKAEGKAGAVSGACEYRLDAARVGASLWLATGWWDEPDGIELGELSTTWVCSTELRVTLLLRALLFLSVLLGPGRWSSVRLELAAADESRGDSRSKPNCSKERLKVDADWGRERRS